MNSDKINVLNNKDELNSNNRSIVKNRLAKFNPKIEKDFLISYLRLKDQNKSDWIENSSKSNLPTPGTPSFDPNANYVIEMLDIYKTFNNGKIIANNGITFRVKKNECHAIIGENGAGKSVLMSILFGIYTADSGIIKINGEEVIFSSAKDASYKGLGMVHQHFKLVDTNSVYQNVILGVEDTNKFGVMEHAKAKQKLKNIIKKYNFNLDINKKVSKLSVAEQQKTEILKLLYRDLDILIFDEPTAVLSVNEISQFLEIIKQLKQEGKTIILIDHKFYEIKEVADRATIIRLGTFISDFDVNMKSASDMARDMVGHDVDVINNKAVGLYDEEIGFEVKDLVINNNPPISFSVHKGEILSIAGVVGNGQSELALALSGLLKPKSGVIKIGNNIVTNDNIKKHYEKGLAFVPEDRHKHAIILDMPVYMNIVLNEIDNQPYSHFGIINNFNIIEHARLFIKENDVRGTSRGSTPIRSLSGGNQQKLVVGREVLRKHELLILVQPTRGLDFAAINKIYKTILDEKEKGKSILLISYELDEIMSLSDTIVVMNRGAISNIYKANEISKEKIGKLMAGEKV